MKQINKLKLTAGMAISLLGAFFAESCDDNDYFGIDDDSFASGLYKNEDFLELSDYSDLYHLSDQDLLTLHEAKKRLNIRIKQGEQFIYYKRGADVNISERLFDYIQMNCNSQNALTHHNSMIKRTKGSDPETNYDRNDCVPIAISHYCNVPYNTIVNDLVKRPGITLENAVKLYKNDASEQKKIKLSDSCGILVLYEHVVNLVSVSNIQNTEFYHVYYKDWQQYPSNGGDGLFLEVTRLKIPCTNSYDYDIIFGFVK